MSVKIILKQPGDLRMSRNGIKWLHIKEVEAILDRLLAGFSNRGIAKIWLDRVISVIKSQW